MGVRWARPPQDKKTTCVRCLVLTRCVCCTGLISFGWLCGGGTDALTSPLLTLSFHTRLYVIKRLEQLQCLLCT